jgi:hypothetical protein
VDGSAVHGPWWIGECERRARHTTTVPSAHSLLTTSYKSTNTSVLSHTFIRSLAAACDSQSAATYSRPPLPIACSHPSHLASLLAEGRACTLTPSPGTCTAHPSLSLHPMHCPPLLPARAGSFFYALLCAFKILLLQNAIQINRAKKTRGGEGGGGVEEKKQKVPCFYFDEPRWIFLGEKVRVFLAALGLL